MENVSVILYGIGALAIVLSFVAAPKADGRFSTGYRGDFTASGALFSLGIFFVILGYAIQKARDFADAEPIYVSIINTSVLVVASLIFLWRLTRSVFETRKDNKVLKEQASTQLRIEHEEREKHEREEQRREQRASDERERLVQEVRDKQERLEQATCKAEARRSELWERYGDDEIVENILGQKIWVGMTEDQLSDSMGTPKDTSTKESTRSKIEVWKYDQTRVNSYALKITLKDGIVEQFVDNR